MANLTAKDLNKAIGGLDKKFDDLEAHIDASVFGVKKEIGGLRMEVGSLRTEMTEGFESVDIKLDAIRELLDVRPQVQELQRKYDKLVETVSRLEKARV